MPGLLGLLMHILHKRYEIYPYQRDMQSIAGFEKKSYTEQIL